ncbi:hypothetical protein [Synechococcus sp. BDU 130192]|uniref:hypothetical protein n=1 Tax=Synechococcus sp. BDU 130192 TaxID=2042059 RepID=UPI000C073F32|nr:hypothetical protein [Synechococcus sp. BDU 130192]
MIFRALLVGILIAFGEIINGNFRVRYLQKKFGRRTGKNISLCSGILLFTLIAYFCLPWIKPQNLLECAGIGLIWVMVMLSLDLYFGRVVFRLPWQKIVDDFNPLKGNFLGIGMLVLLFCPSIIFLLK